MPHYDGPAFNRDPHPSTSRQAYELPPRTPRQPATPPVTHRAPIVPEPVHHSVDPLAALIAIPRMRHRPTVRPVDYAAIATQMRPSDDAVYRFAEPSDGALLWADEPTSTPVVVAEPEQPGDDAQSAPVAAPTQTPVKPTAPLTTPVAAAAPQPVAAAQADLPHAHEVVTQPAEADSETLVASATEPPIDQPKTDRPVPVPVAATVSELMDAQAPLPADPQLRSETRAAAAERGAGGRPSKLPNPYAVRASVRAYLKAQKAAKHAPTEAQPTAPVSAPSEPDAQPPRAITPTPAMQQGLPVSPQSPPD
ncbi:hypothetical protein [Lacticaseibacillus absianus]|uniref:hypothetical protein n=1 Tax=Lacticaseibacillus absianus TaxID=2729623 RepID=UPI0015C9268C|nr:hypothetical protein [Lacticaseibacillus absianus]